MAKKTAKKASKKVAKKTAKKTAKKKTAKKTAKKASPSPALRMALHPSPELAELVGDQPIPRTKVMQKVLDYVKRNGLQDENDKRYINADDKLGALLGGKRTISMYEMNKLVDEHLS